jgi:hypothetical protein
MIPAGIERLLRQSWQAGDVDTFVQELFTLLNNTQPLAHEGPLVLTQTDSAPALVIKNNSGDGNRVIQLFDSQGNDVGGITVGGASKLQLAGGITVGLTDQGTIAVGRDNNQGVQYATTPPPPTAGSSQSGPLVVDFSVGNTKGKKAQVQGQTTSAAASTGGGGTPCQILAGGPGAGYTANVYPQGLAQPSQAVSVQQLQIAANDTIPAGTWTLATLGGDGNWYIQVPVWN